MTTGPKISSRHTRAVAGASTTVGRTTQPSPNSPVQIFPRSGPDRERFGYRHIRFCVCPAIPGPVEGLRLTTAQPDDLAELLVLQRCCWVQEALANDTLDLQPLRETLDDLRASMSTWHLWCVRRHGRLVAAVRARAHERAWLIGRLMVAPDQAGNGIGSWLLSCVEQQAPEETTHCELFTGHRSTRNIKLYERAGYALTAAGTSDGSVYLTKQRQLTA
ncbi:GNAT family N-acetyltransferase [Micromonospora sp. NPDC047548]|uniref:GNAT family N-acetyltransferase n=1 Tax=Micromonospora sp. NPDC047548 TaxID=3155624 RepID=UPI0033CE1B38